MSETFNTHPVRFLKNGGINVGGLIYFGVVNGDPVNVQGDRINIFATRALGGGAALPNPISTGIDGRTAVNGIPAKVWLGERYSEFELDKFNVEQFQDLDKGETVGGGAPISLGNIQGINSITAEANPAISGYIDQQIYLLKVVSTNTGNVTLNIDSQGAKKVKFNFNEEIKPGFFQATQDIAVKYNDTGSPTTDYFSWMDSGRAISILTDVTQADVNVILANGGPSTVAYIKDQVYQFTTVAETTGNVTLKVGTRPTLAIKNKGQEIQPNQFLANTTYQVIFDGTDFELVSGGGLVIASKPTVEGNLLTAKGVSGNIAQDSGIPIGSVLQKNGRGNFDLATATGNDAFTVTGLGFTPKHIILMMSATTLSVALAFMGSETNSLVVRGSGGTSTTFRPFNNPEFEVGSGNNQVFALQSLDVNGFKLSNLKTGSPTGTLTIIWMAFG